MRSKFVGVAWMSLLLVFQFLSFDISGQERTLAGRIVADNDKSPLPGVSVQVQGTDRRTSTDADGRFKISVGPSDILLFTYIGFVKKQVPVSALTGANPELSLTAEVSELNEVVVVGYGTQRRSDVSGAVVSVRPEDMNSTPTRSVAEMLRGLAPGVQVTSESSRPGGTSNILIRGQRSLSGGNGPLYVVDNVPVDATTANDINAADIASVEILKDASSQAIYGARAANGVILITTRRGLDNKVSVDYNVYSGVQQLKKNFSLYDANEWSTLRREAFRTENAQGQYEPDEVVFDQRMRDVLSSGQAVNWQKFMLSDAWMQKHDVSVRGGNDKTKVSVALGYMDQDGMVDGAGFERGTARLNVDQKISNKISVGANLNFTRNYLSSEDGNLNEYITTTPLAQPYDENGNLQLFVTGDNATNPKFLNEQTLDETRNNRLLMNLFGTVELFPGLRYRLNTSINSRSVEGGTYRTQFYQKGSNAGNAATVLTSDYDDYLVENILSYDREINPRHRFDVTLLHSIYKETSKTFNLSGSKLPNDLLGYNGIASAQILNAPVRTYTDRKLLSYMGRLRYTMNDRYLFTFTTRIDGSSVFGPENKYGIFPSAAIAWRLEQEEFIKSIDWISQLKLRVNYGAVGNQAISPYTTLGEVNSYPMLFGDGSYQVGYLPNSRLSNPALKWETTKSLNIGTDFGFFNGRISGAIEYYKTNTSDLLVSKAINQSLGYSSMLVNLGEVENKGMEFMLNTVAVSSQKFTLGFDLTFSRNKNKLIRLDGSTDQEGNPVNDVTNNWFIGKPINVYYNYLFDGIWQTEGDIKTSHMPDAKPGDIRLKDLNGDNVIDANDRDVILRDPDWLGSVTANLKYRAFDLSLNVYAVQGAVRNNPYLYDFNSGGSLSGKNNGIKVNYWTPESPSNEFPRPRFNSTIQYSSSLGYQDASYVRLRNLTLGYTLPRSMSSKAGIQRLRIYTTANNLFTSTDYLSYSPEVTAGGYPEPRIFLFGLNVSL